MTPQPDAIEKHIPSNCDDVISVDAIDHNHQHATVIDHALDSNESSDEHEYFDVENNTEYAGYKLLQQDEHDAMSHTIANDDDTSGDTSDDGDDAMSQGACDNDGQVATSVIDEKLDINYQDLVCCEIDEPRFPTDLTADSTQSSDDQMKEITDDSNEIIRNMSEEHAEKVKNAMSGFQLPPINIPNWAKNISDDDWKKSVLQSLKKPK